MTFFQFHNYMYLECIKSYNTDEQMAWLDTLSLKTIYVPTSIHLQELNNVLQPGLSHDFHSQPSTFENQWRKYTWKLVNIQQNCFICLEGRDAYWNTIVKPLPYLGHLCCTWNQIKKFLIRTFMFLVKTFSFKLSNKETRTHSIHFNPLLAV